MRKTNEITKANRGGSIVTKEYLQQQQTLLAMFNMKGFYSLENYEVVVSEDGRKHLRKRERPLKIIDTGDNEALVATLSTTLGERMFRDRYRKREEDRLELLNPAYSLEVKECIGD